MAVESLESLCASGSLVDEGDMSPADCLPRENETLVRLFL